MKEQQVPSNALRLNVGPMKFADSTESGNVPVEMVARTGDSISHWYWGEVVHDLAGMQPHGDTVPVDYNHDSSDIMGYLNRFETSSGDLVTSGELVRFRDGDRVDEVVTKARAGVPYEASIDFSGGDLQISKYREGESVTVNGREFSGPITVIDRWKLRAVAITPYGADPNTSTALSEGGETSTVLINERDSEMSEKTLSELLQAVEGDNLHNITAWADASTLPIADGISLLHGEECKVDEKKAGKFVEASGIDAGWTWPDNVQFSEPEPSIAPDGADRKEAARFESLFGDVGLRIWARGGSFDEAASAWKDEHLKQLESLEEENKRLTAENAALKMSDSDTTSVGDDPNVQPNKSFKDRMQARVDGLNTQD